jgi:succinyl-diaminopimelate desuccinylase
MVGEDVARPASAVADATADAAAEATQQDAVLRYARALIAAPSENPGGTEDEVADVASGILADLGADIRIVRSETGRPSVVARIGSGDRPRLAWNGHLDTVPAGDPSTWSSGPFEGAVVDGRLVGRGACDMKGPIAAALGAVAALRRVGVSLAGTLDLHLVADEELAGIHGTRVLRDEGLLDHDAAIVGEPSEMDIALAERGGAWVTAVAHGKAAHGSQPHLGVNAILTMSRFLLRLPEALPDRVHPLVGGPTVNVALVAGGSAPNVVPDRCEVEIDRRIIPGEEDPGEVLAPFLRLVDDLVAERPDTRIEISLKDWTEAAETTGESAIASLSPRRRARHHPSWASQVSRTLASTSTTRTSPR